MLKVENKGRAQIKSRNKIRIFNYILENQPVSRTEISKNLQISTPSVTRIIESLIQGNFIKEVGSVETRVGRKPVKLEINKSACYSIGISITKSKIYIALVNLGREVVYNSSRELKIKDGEQLLSVIENIILETIVLNSIEKSKILGVGIASRGIVDYEKGVIDNWNHEEKICNIKVKEYLEGKFGFLVKVDNNINTILFGEYWFDNKLEGDKKQNLICVYCGEGIGGSIIINGQLLRGQNNLAGRMAHIIVEDNGRKCSCGNKGCLEPYASIQGIERSYRENKKTNEITNIKDICENANNNDVESIKTLNDAIDKVAIAITNSMVLLNPEIVMIIGDIFDNYHNALDYLKSEVNRRSFNKKLTEVIWKRKIKNEFMIEVSATALIYDEVLSLD